MSKRTIDYYTKIGILTPERSESNYRFYGEDSLEALHFVSQCKEQNIPLAEIKEKISLYYTNSVEKEKLLKYAQILSRRMEHLEAELKEIKPLLESLNEEEQRSIINRMSPQSMALAQSLLILLN